MNGDCHEESYIRKNGLKWTTGQLTFDMEND